MFAATCFGPIGRSSGSLCFSLAKATIMWNWSVKIHRYMICGVVATSISGCGVFTECWHTVHTPQPEILVVTTPQII